MRGSLLEAQQAQLQAPSCPTCSARDESEAEQREREPTHGNLSPSRSFREVEDEAPLLASCSNSVPGARRGKPTAHGEQLPPGIILAKERRVSGVVDSALWQRTPSRTTSMLSSDNNAAD